MRGIRHRTDTKHRFTFPRLGLLAFAAAVAFFSAPLGAQAKTASTIYTAEKVVNARENVANFQWARDYRDQVVNYSSYWLMLSDEQIWKLPVEQSIPRSIYVNKEAGCPIHGKELIDRYGVYGWKVDPVYRPWKVRCPIGGETWPTNDFEAFYGSGKGAGWEFSYDRADRSLLRSADPNRSYGIDDGTGYVSSSGTQYNFIAYYVHWGVWQKIGRAWSQALENLSEAYLLTGDPVYARKTAILLVRIADLLPTMDSGFWHDRGYYQGDGNSGVGLALGSIWDAALASSISRSYDAIYPYLHEDGSLYTFLVAKHNQYGVRRIDTPEAYANHMGDALAILLQSIQDRRIRANEGVHQAAYAQAAIALDDTALTPSWLNWLNVEGDKHGGGGHLPSLFVDLVDRDGGSNEASPGYTAKWLEVLQPLADLLEDSPYAGDYSITQYPNFRNFLSFPYWLQLTPNYYPHIGDDSKTGNPGLAPGTDPNRYAAAFHRYGFPELAQMAYELNGNSAVGLHGNIWDPGAAKTATAIQAVVDTKGTIKRDSRRLSGYGLSSLLDTAGGKPAATWLYSGRQNKHGHWDRLNLGLMAYGLNLMPDLGYPDFPQTDSPNYWGWQNNTISHNTVVVDARRQDTVAAGSTKAYLPANPVKVMEADGHGVYGGTYWRSLIQVPSGDSFYLVDLFRVQGGADHLYSFHAGPGAVSTNGLSLVKQSGGTYAGANVSLGQFYDGPCCAVYDGSGFQFLDNVSRDGSPAGAFTADWSVVDNWNALSSPQDTHLKLWSVSDRPDSVAVANGYPPSNKPGNPSHLRYLLERRVGAAPLTTTFAHVIDPYVGASKVASVERFTPEGPVDAGGFPRVGLRVTLADGRVDTVIHSLSSGTLTDGGLTVTGRGAVIRRLGSDVRFAYLIAGTSVVDNGIELFVGPGTWEGTVTYVNQTDVNNIRLHVSPAPPWGEWNGRHIRVKHAGGHDPFYKIAGVELTADGAIVSLGRTNLVREHIDPTNYDAGYLYDVAAGDTFEIQSDVYREPPFNTVEPVPEEPVDGGTTTEPTTEPTTDTPTTDPTTDTTTTDPTTTDPTTDTTTTDPVDDGEKVKGKPADKEEGGFGKGGRWKSPTVASVQVEQDDSPWPIGGCSTGGSPAQALLLVLPAFVMLMRRRIRRG